MKENQKYEDRIKKLWKKFSDIERIIAIYFSFTSTPVKIDPLISLSGLSAFNLLNIVENLKKCGIVSEKKETGKGVYFQGILYRQGFSRHVLPEKEVHRFIQKVIDFVVRFQNDSDVKTLTLADIYFQIGPHEEGWKYIKQAADILYYLERKDEAAPYYEYLIDHFIGMDLKQDDIEFFLDSVYKRVSMVLFNPIAFDSQLEILKKAREVAKRYKHPEYLAKINLLLGFSLHNIGDQKSPSKHITDFLKFLSNNKDEKFLKEAVYLTTISFITIGKLSEVVKNYENIVGHIEEFSDSEEELKSSLFVAFSHVMSGRISRGIGMIDSVRNKAQALNLWQVENHANFVKAIVLIGLKKISEAEKYIEKLWALPKNTLDVLFVSIIYCCKAYLSCDRHDYRDAYEHMKKGFELRDNMGMPFHPIFPWLLESIHEIELNGFSDSEVNFSNELEKAIKTNNLFLMGTALRYRALSRMKEKILSNSILADLKNSEKYLLASGAKIELARTRIAIKEYHDRTGRHRLAMSYMEKSWKFLSKINPGFFPNDLLNKMPWNRRIELTIDMITQINKSLGTVKNRSVLLEKVINAAMDFTMATQGGFFVLPGDSKEPELVASRNLDLSLLSRKSLEWLRQIVTDGIKRDQEIFFNEGDGFTIKSNKCIDIKSAIGIPVKLGISGYGYLIMINLLLDASFSDYKLQYARMLASQIEVGLSNIHAHEEIKQLKDRFEGEALFYKRELGFEFPVDKIIGNSEKIKLVKQKIRQVAPTDTSVLILGETGVGKELVAKSIHNLSERKNEPFIPVNLSTFPQDLIASELFGHEKGAFTGATTKKKGRFELADGGTIFLDEIGELPDGLQVKLLRVLQERAFERLGSSTPIESNFRVVAATNKNLHKEVEKGTFRKDLYYRLNVFPIYVPSLKERKSDIEDLVRHFADKYSHKLGKIKRKVPKEEINKLIPYHWPGNVRELEHFVERAIILSNGYNICFSNPEYESRNDVMENNSDATLLEDIERAHISKILKRTLWKISGPSGAATLLGLPPSTLYHRIQKLGIKRPAL